MSGLLFSMCFPLVVLFAVVDVVVIAVVGVVGVVVVVVAFVVGAVAVTAVVVDVVAGFFFYDDHFIVAVPCRPLYPRCTRRRFVRMENRSR